VFTLRDGTDRAVIAGGFAVVDGGLGSDVVSGCTNSNTRVPLEIRYDVIDRGKPSRPRADELVDDMIFHRVSER
jgi:hypothetical protein